MGQQQLMLLVIGVVLVGFAVLSGFDAMATRHRQSVADVLVERNLTIASDAVFWKTKRDPYNGGHASYEGLETDGMQKIFAGDKTDDGLFMITRATSTELEITAVSISYPELGVRTLVRDYDIVSTEVAFDGSINHGPAPPGQP